ncbi:carbohydrate-binding module family 12 protein [Laetiporus sulphureus 93-53]|uniref:Carbohydrate-binding module family 12 protein n=1 Tax=Laetiporus sulphureus 93-53 TaxID=1314785 RepID=A0A165FMR3_9APHY|nr:carbohydrate-binding module family 12 protein [Laetiporus sulphureus 93-53]KZT09204.1 carbohydrate-binding module family 12 protein [Laetiporus sulphureus 93-53]
MSKISEWQPGTHYDMGSEVVYQGVRYKIIQAHTSEPGWEPPQTPALWGRMQDDYSSQTSFGYGDFSSQPNRGGGPGGDYNPSYVQPGQYQPPSPAQGFHPQGPPQGVPPPSSPYQGQPAPSPAPPSDEKQWDQHSEQNVEIHEEERQKKWYELDEHRRKQLEVGGGLVAGLAAVGAGYYAYKSHQKSEEEKKAQVWGLQNWLQDAQARTAAYHSEGRRTPVTWVLSEGNRIPPDAITGGEHNGQPLYICRGFYEGGIQVGKVSPAFERGAVVGYGSHEAQLPKYEILVGDPRALRWVDVHGRLNVHHLGARPVEGGQEADGTLLYIAKAQQGNNIVPGKVSEKHDCALIPANNTEIQCEHYRVLCYA